jgi:hypothetical protein
VTDEEFDVWLRIFAGVHPDVLARALNSVTQNSERMPTPGTVTKAIAKAKEEMQIGEKPRLTCTAGKDSRGIPCVFWSDEPNVPAYRATNCPEGRLFLSTLASVAGIQPDEAAKYMEKWSR